MEVQAKIIQKKRENRVQFRQKFTEYENILKESFAKYNCTKNTSSACIWVDKYISAEKDMATK